VEIYGHSEMDRDDSAESRDVGFPCLPQVVATELNDSSCHDREQRGRKRTTLAEGPREEVGSRFAAERKRLMYDRRRKKRSQQSGTTGGFIPS